MFAGIDVAAERHTLARLDNAGAPIGRAVTFSEDSRGYDALLEALGVPPALVVLEATGHYWKNLFAVLTAAGHDVALINPVIARRFQQTRLERTKTDRIDAVSLARLAFEKRPEPTHCTMTWPRTCASSSVIAIGSAKTSPTVSGSSIDW